MVSLVIVAFQRAYLPMIGWLVFAVNTLSTGMCFCLGCSVNVFRRSGELSSFVTYSGQPRYPRGDFVLCCLQYERVSTFVAGTGCVVSLVAV